MHNLLALALTLSSASMAFADCCYKDDNDMCADGTVGTFYCGNGPCNIFGCNCDGGCRSSNSKRDVPANATDAEELAAATGGSPNMTLAEFLAAVAGHETVANLTALFHEYDKNGDGVITVDEMWLT